MSRGRRSPEQCARSTPSKRSDLRSRDILGQKPQQRQSGYRLPQPLSPTTPIRLAGRNGESDVMVACNNPPDVINENAGVADIEQGAAAAARLWLPARRSLMPAALRTAGARPASSISDHAVSFKMRHSASVNPCSSHRARRDCAGRASAQPADRIGACSRTAGGG